MKRSIIHEALISLIEARCILDRPDKWTKGEYARDVEERSVNTNNPLACKYCLHGAIIHSAHSRASNNKRTLCPSFIGEFAASDVVAKAISFCVPHLPPTTGTFFGDGARIINFNDRVASHKDMLLVLDQAIIDAKVAFEQIFLETQNESS